MVIILAYVFRTEIVDLLGCFAYYDQCTAERIEGLTDAECFERDASVAYLIDDGICLVEPSSQ